MHGAHGGADRADRRTGRGHRERHAGGEQAGDGVHAQDRPRRPVLGLAPTALFATVAKLVPAAGGVPSRWQSYVNRTQTAFATGPKRLASATQADAEYVYSGQFGDLDELGDGRYRYSYDVDLTQVTAQSPSPTTPRPPIASASRSGSRDAERSRRTTRSRTSCPMVAPAAARSGLRPPGTATTARTPRDPWRPAPQTEYCVTCHNPATVDPDGGEDLDLAYLAHSIHSGELRGAPMTRPARRIAPWSHLISCTAT